MIRLISPIAPIAEVDRETPGRVFFEQWFSRI